MLGRANERLVCNNSQQSNRGEKRENEKKIADNRAKKIGHNNVAIIAIINKSQIFCQLEPMNELTAQAHIN